MTDTAHEALEDWSLLQGVTTNLGAAETIEAMLAALRAPAPAPTECVLSLWTLDAEADGTAWLTLVGASRGEPGSRHRLPTHLSSGTSSPLLVSTAAETDATARALWDSLGAASVIAVPLARRGQSLGLLTIHWSREVVLGPRAGRIYHVLAGQVALLLDAFLMVDRHRSALAESQRERRLLSTVMDHVPVGILCIEGATRRPLLTNRMGRMMLTGSPELFSEPLPLAHMLYPGTDKPVVDSDLAGVRAALTGQRQTCELDLEPPGGPRTSVDTIGVPVFDAQGRLDQVVVMMADITSHKRAAEERARLQEQVIQAQAAALIERSTPLIPITDDVLVMPLIGTIDRERGHGILEVALQGARERRARVLILDITGVPSLDVQAAEVLTHTARALRLLGVEAVLSGVRPAVAQALVEIDVPLAGIVTCGSLQAAVEYALRRLGRRT